MGGIITTVIIKKYNLNQSIQPFLPSYYISELTLSSLQLCSKHWEDITLDKLKSFRDSATIKTYFDSCKMWLHSLIYNELITLSNYYNFKVDTRHTFINLMRAMIVVNLKYEENNDYYEKETILLCNRILNLGFDHQHFIAFGYALLNSLSIMSGNEFTSQLKNAWKSFYSSILSICLPCCPQFKFISTSSALAGDDSATLPNRSGLMTKTSSGSIKLIKTDPGNSTNIVSVITPNIAANVNFHNEVSSNSHLRMYTSLHNSVLL